jgi:hypothetical protein
VRLEHQVERARLGVQSGVSPSASTTGGRSSTSWRWSAVAQLAGAAVDRQVGECLDVTGRDPHLRFDHGQSEADVVALLDQ